MRRVVMFSSGAGSWAAARRAAAEHGTDDLWLVFADVSCEDEDNYRFLIEAASDIFGYTISPLFRRSLDWRPLLEPGRTTLTKRALWRYRRRLYRFAGPRLPRLVWLVDGRTIWDVFRDRRFLGNSRVANCSQELKQKPARAWLDEHCDPASTIVYVGIDWSESHRLPAIQRAYLPYQVEAPLTEPPYSDKGAILAALRSRGIEPPRLYDLGFAHANCGGGCVRAGQGAFVHLLRVMPERYAEWEREEAGLRQFLGREDIAILRDRSGGTVRPLTLTELRLRADEGDPQLDLLDIGGCGCFAAPAAGTTGRESDG